MIRLNIYRQKDYRFSYLRTKDGAEIDVIVERPGCCPALVEIKSTEHVDERDIRNLSRFVPDFPKADVFCFSRDLARKQIGDVLAVPWQTGLEELGL